MKQIYAGCLGERAEYFQEYAGCSLLIDNIVQTWDRSLLAILAIVSDWVTFLAITFLHVACLLLHNQYSVVCCKDTCKCHITGKRGEVVNFISVPISSLTFLGKQTLWPRQERCIMPPLHLRSCHSVPGFLHFVLEDWCSSASCLCLICHKDTYMYIHSVYN